MYQHTQHNSREIHTISTHIIYHKYMKQTKNQTHPSRCHVVIGIEGSQGIMGWERDFLHQSTPNLGTTQPPIQLVPGLSWG